MLDTLLRLTGLDVRIERAKYTVDHAFHEAADYGQSLASSIAIKAACILAGALFTCAAAGVGLIMLYRWLAITQGPFVALGVIGGIFVALAIVMIAVAASAGRMPRTPKLFDAPPMPVPVQTAERPAARIVSPRPTVPVNTDTAGLVIDIVKKALPAGLTAHPLAGQLVTHLAPRAEDAAKDAIASAANAVRTGDRSTVLVILAGAALAGFMVTRAVDRA